MLAFPIIGLLAAIDDEATATLLSPYATAIESAGGLPLLLPYTERADTVARFVTLCDGFFFTGGVDIHPSRYGQAVSPACGDVQALRDTLEFAVWEQVLPTGKPILGVCRGAQLINVALGGTLYQDVPTERPSDIAHRQTEGKFEYSHDVVIVEDTPLHRLCGQSRMRGNSFHHQAIRTLGQGLEVMAHAEDGVIEAVWLPSHPYLRAYQWHPERLYRKDEYNRTLFDEFISASKKYTTEARHA